MTDGAIRDPELALSIVHAPRACRPAMTTLWRLDERLGAIVAEGAERNAAIAAIKLAWWREALERLDTAPPPAEPLLRAIAADLLPDGVTGAELAAIAGGWDVLLEGMDEAEDDTATLARHAAARGGGLFTIAARLLGGAGALDVAAAGGLWALASLAPPFRDAARELARAQRPAVRPRWPRRLRAIGVLAILARDRMARPAALPGSPRRIGRALWHAVSGY